jgi:DNA-binding MarR family transcriptional regulator
MYYTPMRDGTFGDIETEVTRLMRRAESTRRATPVAPHRALDRAAYAILRHLHGAGPQNVSALAAALHLDGSTVTRQVAAMQRAGLVARETDPRDGRGTVVSATATGLARMTAVRRARQELYQRILAGWSDADRTHLATLLRRLNEAIDAYTLGG